jgi:hypothetical protein
VKVEGRRPKIEASPRRTHRGEMKRKNRVQRQPPCSPFTINAQDVGVGFCAEALAAVSAGPSSPSSNVAGMRFKNAALLRDLAPMKAARS